MRLESLMIDEFLQDADERMGITLVALANTFGKIRTGRANPSLLDGITVDYYSVATPLNQVASISVEDARTLLLAPWEKPLVVEIEKAILRSDLGVTPVNNGEVVRIPLPPLTEENRRDLARQAKGEAENSRVSYATFGAMRLPIYANWSRKRRRQKMMPVAARSAFKSSPTVVSPKLTSPWLQRIRTDGNLSADTFSCKIYRKIPVSNPLVAKKRRNCR